MKKIFLSAIIIVTMLLLVIGLELVINNSVGQSVSNELINSELVLVESQETNSQTNNVVIFGSSIDSNIESAQKNEDDTKTVRRAGNRFIDVSNPENVYTSNEIREISQNQGILNNQRVIII